MAKTKSESTFVLSPETYWSPERPHLSVSQINDYLKSPEYFYKKHVLKQIPKKVSAPMRVGSFVDALLTNPKEAPKFEMKVLARDDKETYARQKDMDEMHLLTEQEFLKGTQLVDFIKSQPFWKKNLENAIFQMPMEMGFEMPQLKKSVLLCGLPDRMDWEGDVLHIQDLKMSSFIKNSTPAKWFYNAKEMGYIRQFAMYRMLAAAKYDIPLGDLHNRVKCSHMVGIWHEDSLCDTILYSFPASEVDHAQGEIFTALRGIMQKQFGRKLVDWDNSVDLSRYAAGAHDAVAEEEDEEEDVCE